MSQKMMDTESGDGISSESENKININLKGSQDSKEHESLSINIANDQNTNSPTQSIHSSKEEVDNQWAKEKLMKESLGYEPGTLEQMDSLEPLAATTNDTNSKNKFRQYIIIHIFENILYIRVI